MVKRVETPLLYKNRNALQKKIGSDDNKTINYYTAPVIAKNGAFK